MFERIIEIIVFVISELRQNKSLKEIDFTKLQELGYTTAEISTAFSWLADKAEIAADEVITQAPRNSSFRILHDVEKDLFSKEAWGELINMQRLSILSNEQLEFIIEKAVMAGAQEISSADVKTFVANLLFTSPPVNYYGSRVMLNMSDSIN